MIIFLQIAVTCATIVAISAGIPQLRKLIRLKNSDEFNFSTWLMWVVTQVIAVSYAIALGDPLLIAVNSAWVLFYGAMVVLIVRYRPREQLAIAMVSDEVPIGD